MPVIHHQETVPYTTVQMYELVNDVRSYPEFLPWCSTSEVLHEDEDELQAELTISAAGMKKSFTTRNLLRPNKMIEIRLVNGPFKHLEGFWRFSNADDEGSSTVILDLEYEFSGSFLDMVIEPIFNQVANSLVHAFCQRAGELYG